MRIAVISPFLDRQHGTERCVIEQLERIAAPELQIHLYCQNVADLRGIVSAGEPDGSTRFVWHKVPSVGGPHLVRYLWWIAANHALRLWHRLCRGLQFDVLYSPGINAFDADAITVHIVFEEFYRQVRDRLRLQGTPPRDWPVLVHRKVYYSLLRRLERLIYGRGKNMLAAVSSLVASQLAQHYGRSDAAVIRNGVDADLFSPERCSAQRARARQKLRLSPEDFTLLLIGNDWRKKGLTAAIEALAACRALPLKLLVVGDDDRGPYVRLLERTGVAEHVSFFLTTADVLQFYAAADAYVGPSLEDAYGLPVVEAMACGLPVIASSRAGVSEIIHHRQNGLILDDPQNAAELARLVTELYSDPELRVRVGREARLTTVAETWERNAADTWRFLMAARQRKLEVS